MKPIQLKSLLTEQSDKEKINQLYTLFVRDIAEVDDNLSYKIFAEVIIKIIRDEYGSHIYKPFLEIITNELV